MARQLADALQALADEAGNGLTEIDWPVAIINAVWSAKERYEEEDPTSRALDRVEAQLAETLGVEVGERLTPEQMVERLMAMRTTIRGGAVLSFGPAGLLALRRVLSGEASPDERQEIEKAIAAAIGVNAEIEAATSSEEGR